MLISITGLMSWFKVKVSFVRPLSLTLNSIFYLHLNKWERKDPNEWHWDS